MKNQRILQAAIILCAASFIASCGTVLNSSSNQFSTDSRESNNAVNQVSTSEKPATVVVNSDGENKVSGKIAPGFEKKRRDFPLVKVPKNNIYRDGYGRYYHICPNQIMYWKSSGNKYYMDKSYLYRVDYTEASFKEWSSLSKGK